MIIKITVKDKRPQVEGTPIIVCGNSDYTLEIKFDQEWSNAAVKTARFVYVKDGKVQHQDVVFTGGTAAVPVLSGIREVQVGLFSNELRTTTPAVIPCDLSIRCGTTTPDDYTPSQYDQIIALLNDETVLARMNDLETILGRVPLVWQNGNITSGPDNQALTPPSAAIGYKTKAGGKAYKITGAAQNGDMGIFTLATVEGLETGMEYHALWSNGEIYRIEGNDVYVDGYIHTALSGEPDDPENFKAYDYLTIVGRPDLGDTEVGFAAFATGRQTVAQGPAAHAEGDQTVAVAAGSHAEGQNTKAHGVAAHAEGSFSNAYGQFSHAEGENTKAFGIASHAEGFETRAGGYYSHAEGGSTNAGGQFSHAEGQATEATNLCAHAQGMLTRASGKWSSASGYSTRATQEAQSVVGQYNEADAEALFIVGNGTGEGALRNNAFAVRKDGSLVIDGEIFTKDNLSTIASKHASLAAGAGDPDTYMGHEALSEFLETTYNAMKSGDVRAVTIRYDGDLFGGLPVLCVIHRAKYDAVGMDYGIAVFMQYDLNDGVRTWYKCCINGAWNDTRLHNGNTDYTIRPKLFDYGSNGTLMEAIDGFLDEMEDGTFRTIQLRGNDGLLPEVPMDVVTATFYRAMRGYGHVKFEGYAPNLTETLRLRSVCYNGKWQPLEWENPPMILGEEYRTTERNNGDAVYTRLLDLGPLPPGGGKTTMLGSFGIKHALRCAAYVVGDDTIPATNSGYAIAAYFSPGAFYLYTETDLSHLTARAQIWYTKN